MRTVKRTTKDTDIERLPTPSTPMKLRIALAASLVVVGATTGSCLLLLTHRLPPEKATTEGAQDVVEQFIDAASRKDTVSMAGLLTGEAKGTMDDKVLSAIAEYVQTKVGTPAGFHRTDQQVLRTGPRQRLFLSVTVGGFTSKAQIRSTLAYEGSSWKIETIEIR